MNIAPHGERFKGKACHTDWIYGSSSYICQCTLLLCPGTFQAIQINKQVVFMPQCSSRRVVDGTCVMPRTPSHPYASRVVSIVL